MIDTTPARLIVGLTGATGTILGVRLLEALRAAGVESHLVMTKWAIRTLVHETDYSAEDVQRIATHTYRAHDQGAAISSGSFLTRGMVVCPCSMRTLASIAHGVGDQLVHRAADVILKERRMPIFLVVTDGLYKAPRLSDFVFHMHEIRGRTEVLGPLEPPPSDQDLEGFVETLRTRMVAQLEAWRREDHARA